MNYATVKTLILKDWYLQRWQFGGCLVAGLVALVVMGISGEAGVFSGTVLLITAMIVAGVNVALSSIVGERKEQTLAFVMSLPVSPRDYTASKLIGGSLLLFIPWTALMAGSFGVILSNPSLPDGLLPHTAVMLTELLASAFVLLAVAIITESQAWTLSVMLTGNLFINWFLFFLARTPAVREGMSGPTPVWNDTILMLLAVEAAVIVASLSVASYIQARKTDYL